MLFTGLTFWFIVDIGQFFPLKRFWSWRLNMATNRYKNRLLRALSEESLQRLKPEAIAFEVLHDLERPGEPIRNLFFIEEGMASVTTSFKNGSQIEVGTIGYEGAAGISALMGTKLSLNRVYTQIAGCGFRVPMRLAKEEFAHSAHFRSIILRYVQTQLLQAMQYAGCNAKHSIDQRLARWLLTCKDRAHSTTFNISQEFVADMLGAGRPAVTQAANKLKQDELITLRRREITILDASRLEERSCECYLAVKDHIENFAEYDNGQ